MVTRPSTKIQAVSRGRRTVSRASRGRGQPAHGDRRIAQAWRPPRGAWSERTQLVRPRKRALFGGIAVGELGLPIVLLVIAGTIIGGYVVRRGGGALRSREVAVVSAPEPPPPGPPCWSTSASIPCRAAPRSTPQFVGTTPVNATVDASREYDLVFTYPNEATRVEHLDARATRRVTATLGAGGRERHEVHEEASR